MNSCTTLVRGRSGAAAAPSTHSLTVTRPTRATARTRASSAPLLIGHRGAAGTAPENTVPGFRQAVEAGADFFEIDVQLSADGVPFASHDATPARTTDVAQVFPGRENDPITSFTWAELQQLDAGSHFSPHFAGERIPHLDDAARAASQQTGVFIEIKSPQHSPGIEEVVASALRENPGWRHLAERGMVEVLGFDAASNRRFAELAPEIPLQQLTDTVPDAQALAEIARYANHVSTDYRALDAEAVGRVKAAGLGVCVYTVDSLAEYEHLAALGVERITGDFPAQLSRHEHGREPFPHRTGVRLVAAVHGGPCGGVQSRAHEHVVLHNTATHPVDVSGYQIRATHGTTLSVGQGYVLPPGETLHVYTGPGRNRADACFNHFSVRALDGRGDSVALWCSRGTLQDTFST